MKLTDMLIAEGRYSDVPKEDTLFYDNGTSYYIEKISGDKVTAKTYRNVGSKQIVLNKKDIKYSLSNLEMRGALDVIQFEKNPFPNVMTEKEYDDSIKAEKERLKDIAEEEQKAKRREAYRNKPISTSKYRRMLKDAMDSAKGDGHEEHTFDLAMNLAHDHEISKYCKHEYGRNWQQHLQWDLETLLD